MNTHELLNKLFKKYDIKKDEQIYILEIINPIMKHKEFKRRMTEEFFHHDKVTLGEHILEDTILTYKLSKKYQKRDDYDTSVALKISMFHDLYVAPWQNNPDNKAMRFSNKHGFIHPIESVLNAIKWFPDYFSKLDEADKIIDGILHHMYPLPLRIFIDSKNNEMELKNMDIFNTLNSDLQKLLIESSNRYKIGAFSFAKSKYKEGKVMSNADKIISFHNLRGSNIHSISALFTGKNKNIKKEK